MDGEAAPALSHGVVSQTLKMPSHKQMRKGCATQKDSHAASPVVAHPVGLRRYKEEELPACEALPMCIELLPASSSSYLPASCEGRAVECRLSELALTLPVPHDNKGTQRTGYGNVEAPLNLRKVTRFPASCCRLREPSEERHYSRTKNKSNVHDADCAAKMRDLFCARSIERARSQRYGKYVFLPNFQIIGSWTTPSAHELSYPYVP